MAHTDRDDERWYRHNHGSHPAAGECTYRPGRAWSPWYLAPPRRCLICDRIWSRSQVRLCVSVEAKPEWNKAMRREERAKARNVLNRARAGHYDWDDVAIDYRRPYFD